MAPSRRPTAPCTGASALPATATPWCWMNMVTSCMFGINGNTRAPICSMLGAAGCFSMRHPVTSSDTAGSTLAHSGAPPDAPPDDRDSAFDFGGGGNLGRSVGAVGSFGGSVGLLSGAVRRSGGRRKSRDCQLAWIEARAKQLCEASNFSEDGMVQLAKMLEGNKNYRNILRKQTKQGHTVVLGAFVHGGVCGITSLTLRMPETCRFVNSWLCHHAGRAFGRWSSVHIGVQVRAPPHIDKNNEPQSQNLTITAGDFRGGELWLASNTKGGGNTEVGKVVNGKRRVGYLIDTRMKPLVFDPKCPHASVHWSGFRVSVTAYTVRDLSKLSAHGCVGFSLSCDRCLRSVCMSLCWRWRRYRRAFGSL